ncbi:hypothetical protein KJ815_04085, partial [bacterium]|nr:hypothetical protein [bacterium]
TSPVTSAARIRISGTVQTGVTDVSDANFTIGQRTITVTSPNGGENWREGTAYNITWTSQNVTGEVAIDVNRGYPGGAWEPVTAGTANDGIYEWTVSSPSTAAARIRITSLTFLSVWDESNANFAIVPSNLPPVVVHDPLDDQAPAEFTVTAIVTDDAGGFVTRFFYKLATAGSFDSLLMSASGYANEYAVSVGPLTTGIYDYYVKSTDVEGLPTVTDVLGFEVGAGCGVQQAFDDGVAEISNWSENIAYLWAVRFDAGPEPYVLCEGLIGVSALEPDNTHSLLEVIVFLANGVGGMPGTPVFTKTVGSIGNVIGGLPADPASWARVVFRDDLGDPLVMTSDFYVSVASAEPGKFEAFLHDTSSARAGRSVVYDPCDETWMDELAVHASARPGNRMIRVSGFPLAATTVVAYRDGNNVRLLWNDVGAPYYRVYSATTAEGPFTYLEGSTPDSFFVDTDAMNNLQKFYVVLSSTTP